MKQQIAQRALLCAFLGILLVAYHQHMLIIQWPWQQYKHARTYNRATKKTVNLHYWHHDAWHTEKTQLIMAHDHAQALTYLINSWLTLLYEEKKMPKKIELQTVLISPTGHELFLSFNHAPFGAQQSMYEKWMWVEALLKTVKEYDTAIDYVHLLVRHKPLHDAHLDFINGWPINGFIHT